MTDVTGDDAPMTFQAYAERIGKSRPYVSKLVAEGRITARALTADRKIIPSMADADRAAMADPARATKALPLTDDGTYARQKARKAAADAETAEIQLRQLKGELISRTSVVQTIGPWIRQLRDDILGVPRDVVLDPVNAADCEAELASVLTAFATKLANFSAEVPPHGGSDTGAG